MLYRSRGDSEKNDISTPGHLSLQRVKGYTCLRFAQLNPSRVIRYTAYHVTNPKDSYQHFCSIGSGYPGKAFDNNSITFHVVI